MQNEVFLLDLDDWNWDYAMILPVNRSANAPKGRISKVKSNIRIKSNDKLSSYLHFPNIDVSINITSYNMITFPCNECDRISQSTFGSNLIDNYVSLFFSFLALCLRSIPFYNFETKYSTYLRSISNSVSLHWKVI